MLIIHAPNSISGGDHVSNLPDLVGSIMTLKIYDPDGLRVKPSRIVRQHLLSLNSDGRMDEMINLISGLLAIAVRDNRAPQRVIEDMVKYPYSLTPPPKKK